MRDAPDATALLARPAAGELPQPGSLNIKRLSGAVAIVKERIYLDKANKDLMLYEIACFVLRVPSPT